MLYQYRYDWMDQFWAANILLATLTDGGTFHSQSQSFLKFWICGTDRVRAPLPLLPIITTYKHPGLIEQKHAYVSVSMLVTCSKA